MNRSLSTKDKKVKSTHSVYAPEMIAGAILTLISGIAFLQNSMVSGKILFLIMILSLLGNLFLLQQYKKHTTFSTTLFGVFASLFLYFFTIGWFSAAILSGLLIFPPFIFSFFGRSRGAIAVLLFFLLTCCLMTLPQFFPIPFRYSSPQISFIILLLSFSILTAYVYEHIKGASDEDTNLKYQQLHDEKAKIEKLLSSLPTATFTVDIQGKITSFNRKATELLKYDASEIVGRPCSSFIGDPCTGMCMLKQENVQQKENLRECTMLGKDGKTHIVIKNSQLLFDENEQPTGCIECFYDITDQKKGELELIKAKEAAEAASVAKSTFLATMSHEIRTPMNGILGLNTLLGETTLTDEQREYVDNIKLSSEALLALINDILDFSKIEAGKMQLEVIDFDFRTTIESAIEIVAYKALEKNLELATLIHSNVPNWLCGDPGRLRQVIINLVNNAIKFTEKGEVIITVTKLKETDTHAVLYFSVKDTGIGISEEGKRALFQSFSQVDSSTTRKFGGTGLGLAISKRLSELMHGAMGVESEPNKGSTFWFTAEFVKQDKPGAEKQSGLHDLKGKRILVIDKNQTSRNIFSHYLTTWESVYTCCETPREALELIRASIDTQPFDCILINMMLDGMSGTQLAVFIKSDEKMKKSKIIMITEVGKRGDASLMKKIGVEGYITKPIRQSQLYDCINLVLLEKNQAQTSSIADQGDARLITKHTLAEAKNRGKIRILIAEDNVVNQKVAVKMLEKAGYSCDIVMNGIEAVEAQSKNNYDIILMDCQMPVLSGYDATRAIREEETKSGSGNHVPIIAMTANAIKGDREKCIESGMDDYISKPINFTQALQIIEKWSIIKKGPDSQKEE